jgi:hypothetical protein
MICIVTINQKMTTWKDRTAATNTGFASARQDNLIAFAGAAADK